MRLRLLVTIALIGAPGCVQSPTVPRIGTQEVTLRLTSSTTALAPGETDTITVTAVNHLKQSLRIVFDTSCQILVYVRTRSAHTVVPESGAHDCLPIPSQMVIPAEGSVVREFLWKGGSELDPPGSATRLAPGDYYVSAEMVVGDFRTVAAAVKVTLLP